MKTVFTLFAALALCFLCNMSGFSAEKKPHAKKGTIESIEGTKITIAVTNKGGKLYTHEITKETKIMIDNKEGAVEDLKAGMYVVIENHKELALGIYASETNERVGPPRGNK